MSDAISRLYRAFVSQQSARAIEVIEQARRAGIEQDALFDTLVAPAMASLGAAWANGSLDEYEFTQAAVTAEQLMSFVTPAARSASGAAVVLGTVQGDRHDTRRVIVASALSEVGHVVEDLGSDVAPARFIEGVEEVDARVVILFAELTRSVAAVERIRELLDASGHEHVALLASGGAVLADPSAVRAAGAQGIVTGAESAVVAVTAALKRMDRS